MGLGVQQLGGGVAFLADSEMFLAKIARGVNLQDVSPMF